ncbi:MAG: tetratricopeptide repeat protein [Spirochaetota bacterium]
MIFASQHHLFCRIVLSALVLLSSAPVFAETVSAGIAEITFVYGFRGADGKYYFKLDRDQQIDGRLCLKNDSIVYSWKGMITFSKKDLSSVVSIIEDNIDKGMGAPGIDCILYPDGKLFAFFNGTAFEKNGISASAHPSVFTLLYQSGSVRECVLGGVRVFSGLLCERGEAASFYPKGALRSAVCAAACSLKGANYTLHCKKGAFVQLSENGSADPADPDGRLCDEYSIELAQGKINCERGLLIERDSRGAILNRCIQVNGPYLGVPAFTGMVFLDSQGYPLSAPGGGLVYTRRDAAGRKAFFFLPGSPKKKIWNGLDCNEDIIVSLEKEKGAGSSSFLCDGRYRLIIHGFSPGSVKGFYIPAGYGGGLICMPDGSVDRIAMLQSRGWFYLTNAKGEEAKKDCIDAIALDPAESAPYINLAHYYLYYGKDREKAFTLYEEAFRRGENPYSPQFYDMTSDGKFMKGIMRDPEFRALQKKYRKRRQ